ncbi:24842_t:CDS:1, partial [Racocetra persica]
LSRKPITLDDLRPLINNVATSQPLGLFNNNTPPQNIIKPVKKETTPPNVNKCDSIKDAGTSNIATSSKMDEVPVSDNEALNVDKQQKREGDKESPNDNYLPTVEEFRLFEELEKLEKRLEQEISE